MRILYIAYSCSPYHGSEDAIGWNIPLESAKENTVFVITKEEQRKYIESYAQRHEIKNIRFFYIDIPSIYKKIFKGALYSGRLNIWNRKAEKFAGFLCESEKIELIHQITPVEFRSIGYYGRIPRIKFVCGPVAGGQRIPKELMYYTGRHKSVEILREIVNRCSRMILQRNKKITDIDFLLLANHETKEFLHHLIAPQTHTEICVDVAVENSSSEWKHSVQKEQDEYPRITKFLVVGRLIYLKGHELLMDALERIPKELKFECHIVGEGKHLNHLRKCCADKNLEDVVFFDGAVPYSRINTVYRSADVLIMPSFREATGSVLLEAMSNGLPIVTINRFGGAIILNKDTGWLYEGNSREEYIERLRDILIECITKPEEIVSRSKNAKLCAEKYTWKKRMEYYQSVYEKILHDV